MKFKHVLTILCLMFPLVQHTFGSEDHPCSAVDQVFTLLASAPPWEMLGNNMYDTRIKQIDETFLKVARYDDATIRAAMLKYIDCCRGKSFCEYEANLSIYNLTVLNRFVFNVPERISKEKFDELPFYLGRGGPINDKGVNLLWPLAMEANGNVTLKSPFITFGGPGPDPLAEFDIFQKTFKRRLIPMCSLPSSCYKQQEQPLISTPVTNAMSRYFGVRISNTSPNNYNKIIFDAVSEDTSLPKLISQRASLSSNSDVLVSLDFYSFNDFDNKYIYTISFNAFLPNGKDCYLSYYVYLTYIKNKLTAVNTNAYYFQKNYTTYINYCRKMSIAP